VKCVGRDKHWLFYAKGGGFRRWHGNLLEVVDWSKAAREHFRVDHVCRIIPEYLWYKAGVTWGLITSSRPSFRILPEESTFDVGGSSVFFKDDDDIEYALGLLNTKFALSILKASNPTLNFQVRNIRDVPFAEVGQRSIVVNNVKALIDCSKLDWDSYECAWDFKVLPVLLASPESSLTLDKSYMEWLYKNRVAISETKRLEEENNRFFIDAYGLADELTQEVPIEQITLTVNPAYRYGIKGTEEERNTRFREDSMQELLSYSIGCMMGRYSLDEPGLIYARSGNEGFDASRYSRFPADDDGIVPLTDTEWFGDDAANRVEEFIGEAWASESLEENLAFLAANLSPKKGKGQGEGSRDTIRRYLCDKFYKDHMQTYKKRPIYWLFSSGKQKAFQCLVYLHRYNEGTLARMRTEYVIPLSAKLATHVEKLEQDKDASESAAEVKRLEKQITKLHKQQVELSSFDEKLRHYADQRISLDLDDGVKENYGKFGDLLAEVKAIHGKKPEVI